MIDGVVIKELKVHKDIPDRAEDSDKGFLMEVLRNDDNLLKNFGQTTMSVAYEGTVKAFHWHKKQDDIWFIASGKAKIILNDQRKDSPTYGQTDIILAGENDYKIVLIPIGVAHGYKVLSKEPVMLFYHTTLEYNPNDLDEERLPWDFLGKEIWD